MEKEEKLIVIDGNSLLNRAFYALPLLTNKNGEYSNAVYGFANMLIKVITDAKPTKICVAFDYGKKNFRHEIYKEYKGTRKATPTELVEQFTLARRMLSYMGIKYIEKSGIEADDIIGTISKSANIKTIILSGDKDVLQLIDETTEVWLTRRGITEVDVINSQTLKEKFGWTPNQVIDFKALCGETSDNIPGVAGIGEKTANNLLAQYESLDNIYAHIDEITGKMKEILVAGKESAYLSKTLATIDCKCDIDFKVDDFSFDFPFSSKVFNFFDEYDFRSLMKRKELFSEENQITPYQNDIEVEVVILKDMSKLSSIIKIAKEEGKFAFNISDKLEFAMTSGMRYVVEKEITLFNDGANFDSWVLGLKEIFEDEKILKVFYDAKSCFHFLDKYQIKIGENFFDMSVARYLQAQGLKLREQIPSVEEFFSERDSLIKSLKELELISLYHDVEKPLIKVLFEMERVGFKIDLIQLDVLREQYKKELEGIEVAIKEIVGHDFNINSPKQLSEVLFDELGLSTKFNKKKSTGVEVLNELVNDHPIIPLILRYRKIQKLYSTYIEAWKSQHVNQEGIIHTIFNQTLTSTGRLSSSEPNLQNIPVRDEEGKNLRKLFVSQFEGGKIMSADYNQIELRLLASFSDDEKLVDSFQKGQDIHRATASNIFGVDFNEVTSSMRRQAKAVNFGVVYGISDYGLSQNVGITRKEAKVYIEKYFEQYPRVKEYMDNNVAIAKSEGKIKTYFGRVRKIEELSSSNFMQRSFGERVAKNMPLQGSASDIIKIAMIRVANALKEKNLKSRLILQIHDELIVDVYPKEEMEIEKLLHAEMENVVNFKVKLPVEVSIGKSWFDCK